MKRTSRQLSEDLKRIAEEISSFEEGPTRTGRPAGSAKGGSNFERLVSSGIAEIAEIVASQTTFALNTVSGATKSYGKTKVLPNTCALTAGGRQIVFQMPQLSLSTNPSPIEIRRDWLKKVYPVQEWYGPKLGELGDRGWIPHNEENLSFSGDNYPRIYEGLTVSFDGTILFIENGMLRKKILLECKSAKSSDSAKIDGNAHERFAYQNLEYLEIAALYPNTQLLLLTNRAFVQYRNKYHTGFGVHALRLTNAFCWYAFDMVSTPVQYLRLFQSWLRWLEGE